MNPSWQSHARTLATLAEVMVNAGDSDRAARLVRSISSNWQAHVQAQLVKAMSTTGNVDNAETLAYSITNPDLQAEALATVAEVTDHPRAGRLIAQALHVGDWTKVVMVVAKVEPTIARIIADDVAYLAERKPQAVFISGTTYGPTLKLT
jgi:hypothetical protein